MKKYFGLQKVILALTTLTLVGLSSCNDQNFDWDEAHATEKYEKFTNVFIKEFGQPAEGHQWGFDYADFAMGGGFSNYSPDETTRASYKQDQPVDGYGIRPYVAFGRPKNITQKEHDEVFAWFSNHRVEWLDPYAYYNGTSTRITTPESNNLAKVINSSYPGYGSLINHPENVLGDYNISTVAVFHHGWVQHVARDESNEISDEPSCSQYNCSSMNYLYTYDLYKRDLDEHIKDFNGASGYGWGKQPAKDPDVAVWNDSYLNATLILNADISTWAYESSIDGSKKHDKYYMVYLKGDDYEGWYLGFDLEGHGPNPEDHSVNSNQWLRADGICNDWIIKLTDVGNPIYVNSRIMCEDLGGNFGVSKTDIDYNDVVLDVNYKEGNNGAAIVELKLLAAGGTLPLAIVYESKTGTYEKLFEVHEFFNDVYDGHLSPSQYNTMINTSGSQSNATNVATMPYKSYKLFVNTSQHDANMGGYNESLQGKTQKKITSDGIFSISRLKIWVYKLGVNDYVSQSPTSINEAEWIDLNNEKGDAPLKLCMPQTNSSGKENMWLQERVMITNGYSKFHDWVENPAVKFWDSPNETYLYKGGN